MIQKRKVLSLVVCLMVVGLITSLISGCAPSGNGGDGDGNGDGDETPQYGGELTYTIAAEPVGFDDAISVHYNISAHIVGAYQCLWSGDWTRGNAGGYGTGECDWLLPGDLNRLEFDTGYLAEDWDLGDDYIEFYLRDGVHWQDKFPCNGREVTADDVVYSFERQMTLDTGYLKKSYPHVVAATTVSTIDESTVRFDCSVEQLPELLTLIDFVYIYPQDAIELYGDMNDWENVIGTGAFTLEEYLTGSYLYYEKNPDYWETNPVGLGQGDQLPYLDSVRVLIQPDPSTQDSLFTTGQVDILACEYDRAQQLMDLDDVNYIQYFATSGKAVVCMRQDNYDLPYHDVRVRQALQLAIDNQKMVDEMYGGQGEALYWPVGPCKEYAGAYVPLEDLDDDMIEDIVEGTSISVADLFGYDKELAIELLAEAGYPDGFEAEITAWDNYLYMDPLQVVLDMWKDIGVDVTVNPVDYATISLVMVFRNYDDMCYWGMAGIGTYYKGTEWYGTSMWNGSYIDDPILNDYHDQMMAAYPDEDAVDQIHAEMIPYLLEQCYVIQTAGPDFYRFWWPWVKNYSGEGSIGYYKGYGSFAPYIWIDQNLKESMGYGD